MHGISQARILESAAISFSRGSSRPRDQTHISRIGGWVLYHRSMWETHPITWWKLQLWAALSVGTHEVCPWWDPESYDNKALTWYWHLGCMRFLRQVVPSSVQCGSCFLLAPELWLGADWGKGRQKAGNLWTEAWTLHSQEDSSVKMATWRCLLGRALQDGCQAPMAHGRSWVWVFCWF